MIELNIDEIIEFCISQNSICMILNLSKNLCSYHFIQRLIYSHIALNIYYAPKVCSFCLARVAGLDFGYFFNKF